MHLRAQTIVAPLLVATAFALAAPACSSDPGSTPVATDAGPVLDAPTSDQQATQDSCVLGAYPKSVEPIPSAGDVVPNLRFPSIAANKSAGTLALESFYAPCAPSRLLVLRVGAPWCGTCLWHLSHADRFRPSSIRARLDYVDLSIGDIDNNAPVAEDLPAYQALIQGGGAVAADAQNALQTVPTGTVNLPLYVLVDSKTMRIKNVLADPTPEYFETVAAEELALLDGNKPPAPVAETLVDGFPAEVVDMLKAMRTPGAPPADATNAFADSAPAASLGAKLFADAQLSPSGTISCATCHDKNKAFTDGLPQSVGVSKTDRNAPALALSSHARWQFWDGRADTLWMQALGPIEDDKEMAGDRLFLAHQIWTRYKAEYESVFSASPLPNLADGTRFPARGKPGQPAWDGMAPADRDAVTQVFVNAGKSIAAFERTFRLKPTRLDQYIDGDKLALNEAERNSLRKYFSVGCAQCHFGPTLANDAFFVTRFPTGRQDKTPDVGREAGHPKLLGSEFNSNGRWSDAKTARNLARVPPDRARGAFKTPTLRGIDVTGPFGHGGTIATLEEVVELYGKRGLHDGHEATVGLTEPYLPKFDKILQQEVPIFLKLLRAENAP